MTGTSSEPLVTIGVPTYNRAALLRRSLASVQAQDYGNLEVILSDNASTDATGDVCREVSARDPRFRYVRHPANQGARANFRYVLDQARGTYFMWLADDDWLSPAYVRRSVQILEADPGCTLVAPDASYYDDDRLVRREKGASLTQDSPAQRVLEYYRKVIYNAEMLGVMRMASARQLVFRRALAGDWLIVSALVFQGKVKVGEGIDVHRRTGGDSATMASTAGRLGYPALVCHSGMGFYLTICGVVLADLMWKGPVYRTLGVPERVALGVRAAGILFRRYVLKAARRDVGRLRLRTRAKTALGMLVGRRP